MVQKIRYAKSPVRVTVMHSLGQTVGKQGELCLGELVSFHVPETLCCLFLKNNKLNILNYICIYKV